MMGINRVEDSVGNSDLKSYLSGCLQGKCKLENLLITGDPGTGKTSLGMAFFRQYLNNPKLGMEEEDYSDWAWGKVDYYFLLIHGSTVGEKWLKERVEVAIHPAFSVGKGVYCLIDEIGELWAKKIEMALRPLLECPHVRAIATAQDFKGLEKIAGSDHDRKRWEALVRRFPMIITTQLPEVTELAVFLGKRLGELGMELDNGRTLITLARKFGRNPSRALNVIRSAFARGRKKFTAMDVAES